MAVCCVRACAGRAWTIRQRGLTRVRLPRSFATKRAPPYAVARPGGAAAALCDEVRLLLASQRCRCKDLLLTSAACSPRIRPGHFEALPDSPLSTPRSPRPLRLLSPAGAEAPALERKSWQLSCMRHRRFFPPFVSLLLFVAASMIFMAQWGIGSPSHAACRVEQSEADALASAPPLPLSTCDGRTSRFAQAALRTNDVQVLGTHNSYHVQPTLPLSSAWRYTHSSLAAQLDAGARSVELDVHWDPLLKTWSVYHEPFVDYGSTCGCFSECLAALWHWSVAHPSHAMITVVVEPKYNIDASNPWRGGSTAAVLSLQRVVSALVPRSAIVLPQAVQGTAPTMRAALSTCGWPAFNETRGTFAFVLDVWCVRLYVSSPI